jgi:hypothetical protein
VPVRTRDPIAERQARRAGLSAPPVEERSAVRDPIAERNARRAGIAVSKPPSEQAPEEKRSDPRLSRPIMPRPPSRRGR